MAILNDKPRFSPTVCLCFVTILIAASLLLANSAQAVFYRYAFKPPASQEAEVTQDRADRTMQTMKNLIDNKYSQNQHLNRKQIKEAAGIFDLFQIPPRPNSSLVLTDKDIAFYARRQPHLRTPRKIVSFFAAMRLIIDAAKKAGGKIGNKGDLNFHSQVLAGKLLVKMPR